MGTFHEKLRNTFDQLTHFVPLIFSVAGCLFTFTITLSYALLCLGNVVVLIRHNIPREGNERKRGNSLIALQSSSLQLTEIFP